MIRVLLAVGGLIYLALGTIHLLYTFFTPKFRSFNPAAEEAMKATTPRLTKKTTMWKAWMGFNASHSTGAMFFGLVTLYFAIRAFPLFEESLLLQGLVLANTLAYLGFGRAYWFSIPNTGIALASICFLLALILIHLS